MKSKSAPRLLLFGVLLFIAMVGAVLLWQRTPLREATKAGATAPPPALAASTPAVAAPSRAAVRVPAVAPAHRALRTGRFWDSSGPSDFTRFADWANQFAQAATADDRAALETEGLALARARRDALAALIQSDPKTALELAVPFAVRQTLPGSVAALLEERVSARGDLMVIGAVPLPGRAFEVKPITRQVSIGGKVYEAYTYDWWLEHPSRFNVPIQGIAVDQWLAVSASLVRVLDPVEAAFARARATEAVCSVSGQLATANQTEQVIEVAGKIELTCQPAHTELLDSQLITAAAGGSGPPVTGGTNIAGLDGYTTGRKRMFVMRPYWTNQPVAMSTNSALTHWQNFSNYMYQMSYGQLPFAALGQGSDISTELLMPGSVDDYTAGLGQIFTDIKNVAQNNYGYNLGQYDFIYYVTGGKPSAGYAGLGFVRGVGFHLANGYFDAAVSAHEFGHNLGLNHANFWDTQSGSIIGNGQNSEYGDNNDPMGGGGSPNQFNSRYKNYLSWIPGSDVANLNTTGSGRYRLYCFDLDESSGLRGLRFTRNGSQNYWINFRQRKTGQKALMNGVQLLWTGNGNQSSHLLDVRLKGNADDNAIVLGRTFTDTNLNFHFTPVGKGHTYPESMDVVVNIGAFPANLPPIASVSATPASPGPGQTVTFSASATDPNGDALSYHWEFGDGDYSIDNSPSTTHSFGAAGEYTVQCSISDMKGGVTRRSVVVRVGAPATFRISGHVLDQKNKPLAGIKVFLDAARFAFTDSDGSYTIANLPAGSYTVDALEPVSAAAAFAHPFFNNPVTVGPSFTDADLVSVSGSANIYTPLLTRLSSGWKYLDDGTDPGAGWTTPGFTDTGWSNGAAILGYGQGGESTIVRYGPDANNKHVTTYFRKSFTVPDPNIYTNFLLEVLRDDGVVVYLNGAPIFTNNMPSGLPTSLTYATAAVEPDAYLQIPVDRTLVGAGPNVIAVEMHQATPDSSDLAFDLAFSGLSVTNAVGFNVLYVSSPPDQSSFVNPASIPITAVAQSGGGSVTLVEFFADGVRLGESAAPPFAASYPNPPLGSHVIRAIATLSGGTQLTSGPVTINVTAPGPAPVSLALIPAGAAWKWFAAAAAPVGAWMNPGYNATTWSNGVAQFGYGEGDEVTPIPYGGNNNNRWVSSYYRHVFTVADPDAITDLTLQLKRDDGAIVYLNGQEVLRDNLPAGAIAWGVLATNAADDGQNFLSFPLDPDLLLHGTNLLAVEIHQSALNSSDVSFDLSLDALATTNRSRGIWLASPTNGATFALPDDITLAADVVAGGALGVVKVEFFSDAVKIGEDVTAPFSLDWTPALTGAHQLTAVATDTAGGSITSAPVNITLTPPPTAAQLISFGQPWKYLDDGSNQGTNWSRRVFDDDAWAEGNARLGYGGDGEATTVSFGSDPNNRSVTTYFRRAFTVASPAAFTGLRLRLVRDDAAVVYLNGTEIHRSNLRPGLINFNSLAVNTVNAPQETTPIDVLLPTTGLLAGTNVIAVEVHQVAINSSDIGFDLALLGLRNTNVTTGVYLTSPGQGAAFNVPAVVNLSAFAVAAGGVTKVEFFHGNTKLGETTAVPYNLTWNNPPGGSHALSAIATYNGSLTMTSAVVNITIGPVLPPVTSVATVLLPGGSTWRYLDNGSNQGTAWTTASFNEAGWKTGVARFGYGLDGEFTKISNNITTHYFRRWIVVSNAAHYTDLLFRLQRDDGAVVHLNGLEVYRSNMPTNAINSATLASAAVDTLNENYVFETLIPTTGSGLLVGSNLVALELHQSSANSSDAGFDLELWGLGTTAPRIYLSGPADTAICEYPDVRLTAHAWAGAGHSIAKVEFFDGTNKIGEAVSPPYNFVWPNPPLGAHTLAAVATDNANRVMVSDPAAITVVLPPLIARGAVWKYLDNGSNQGTNWFGTNFNDSAWAAGPARLGYGGDGEATRVEDNPTPGYVAADANRYITTYFRRSFVPPPGLVYTNLVVGVARDDGAVVYLNGQEIFRSNMPQGPIGYLTPASSNAADEQGFFTTNVSPARLASGTNVIAVEVHQILASSSDLGFNLELIGTGFVAPVIPPPPLFIAIANGNLHVSWPENAAGYELYATVELPPFADWNPVGLPTLTTNNMKVLSLTPGFDTQFFRLQKTP